MTSVQVHYEGRVQGVGFRWSLKNLACGFEVAGTAKNLPDGRVELIVQGDEVEDFLDAIRASELAGHIEQERISPAPLLPGLKGFSIIP